MKKKIKKSDLNPLTTKIKNEIKKYLKTLEKNIYISSGNKNEIRKFYFDFISSRCADGKLEKKDVQL